LLPVFVFVRKIDTETGACEVTTLWRHINQCIIIIIIIIFIIETHIARAVFGVSEISL